MNYLLTYPDRWRPLEKEDGYFMVIHIRGHQLNPRFLALDCSRLCPRLAATANHPLDISLHSKPSPTKTRQIRHLLMENRMQFHDCLVLSILVYGILSWLQKCGGVHVDGTLGQITDIGIGSNKSSLTSITSDSSGRCFLSCLRIDICTGFNMHLQGDKDIVCDFKQGQHAAEDLAAMPGVRYVNVKSGAHSCADLYDRFGQTTSGIYDININPNRDEPANIVSVYCDMDTDGGKWMVLLRRVNGSVSFDRSWADYLNQFGDLNGNLWMGLDFMHNVTMKTDLLYELRIDMVSFPRYENGDFSGPVEIGFAKYNTFFVDGADTFYRITVDGFSGNWGDSMAVHNGMMFTANGTENDHDRYSSANCAELFLGPWWYNDCSEARLTGEYGMIVPDVTTSATTYYHGIMWYTYLGKNEHPSFVEMKIRPK